jgi:hypothetical protein
VCYSYDAGRPRDWARRSSEGFGVRGGDGTTVVWWLFFDIYKTGYVILPSRGRYGETGPVSAPHSLVAPSGRGQRPGFAGFPTSCHLLPLGTAILEFFPEMRETPGELSKAWATLQIYRQRPICRIVPFRNGRHGRRCGCLNGCGRSAGQIAQRAGLAARATHPNRSKSPIRRFVPDSAA